MLTDKKFSKILSSINIIVNLCLEQYQDHFTTDHLLVGQILISTCYRLVCSLHWLQENEFMEIQICSKILKCFVFLKNVRLGQFLIEKKSASGEDTIPEQQS